MRADVASTFSRTTLRVIVPVIVLSALAALGMELFGDPTGGPPTGPGTESRSALGHSAFAELLRRSGFVVVTSHLPAQPREGALLILAEPDVERTEAETQRLREQLDGWARVLLALPKRRGYADPQRPDWISGSSLLSADAIGDLLSDLEIEAHVERSVDVTLTWDGSDGLLPSLAQPQLVVGDDLDPRISCQRGMLVGELREDAGSDRLRYVLSDPDLLANHGLGRGDNAALVLALVRELVDEGAPIVFDETLHGGLRPKGLWNALGQFPLVLLSVHGFLTLVVLLLATAWRFGPPVPVPDAFVRSKTTLLDQAARLLTAGRHERAILQRYLRQALHDVAEARHLAAEAEPGERVEHLARLSQRLDATDDPRELVDAVAALDERQSAAPFRTLRLARRIHTWREEMTHGPGPHP